MNFNLWFIPVRMEMTACAAEIKEKGNGLPTLGKFGGSHQLQVV